MALKEEAHLIDFQAGLWLPLIILTMKEVIPEEKM